MNERRVMVVTGGRGFIGRHLVEHFTKAGWEVRSLARPTWELRQPLGQGLIGADVVVHTALAPYARGDAHEVNVVGSRLLVEEVRRHPPTRFIFLSSVSARANAASAYGRDKFEIQSMLAGPRELSIRPGLVLGDGGLFDRIRSTLMHGRIVPLIGGGHQPLQTVHIDDLVTSIDASIRLGRSGVLTVAEQNPVEFRTLLFECARLMRRRVLFLPVPVRLVAVALRLAELVRIHLPVSRDNLLGLQTTEPADVDNDLAGLGVKVRDYRDSLAAIIEG